MDESTAIYFRFPPDPTAEYDLVSYAVAAPDSSSFSDPAKFTLREIVAFMCWRSFVRMGIKFRDFKENSSTTVAARYSSMLDIDSSSQSRKRHHDSAGWGQPKRNKQKPTLEAANTPVEFGGWYVDQLVTLQYLPVAPTVSKTHARVPSRDSGFHEPPPTFGIGSPHKLRHYLPPLTAAVPTTTFCITQILTPTVAVLSPLTPSHSSTNFIVKFPYSHRHLAAELHAYAALSPLQGDMVPYCYGTATDLRGSVVLLTEFIAPGTTIAALRERREWARVDVLRGSAEAAVRRMHGLGVLHRDAKARNFLVCGEGREERVTVVDFDAAKVFVNEPDTLERKAWEDWVFLEEAFKIPVEESESELEDVNESENEDEGEGENEGVGEEVGV